MLKEVFAESILTALTARANRPKLHLEVTTTDDCNLGCRYCFERTKGKAVNDDIKKLTLTRIEKLLLEIKPSQYSGKYLAFWGGEPTLDVEYIKQIIEVTKEFKFHYHIYTNGTNTPKIYNLVNYVKDTNIDFHFQFSYDGEPQHSALRGYNSKLIFKSADLVQEAGIPFAFKATLTYPYIQYMTDIWLSYKSLYDIYGDSVSYAPTLDTSCIAKDTYLDLWRQQLINIAKLEYKFVKENQRTLMSWWNREKRSCNLSHHLHLHSDGDVYLCHGVPYSKVADTLKLGDSKSDLSDLFVKERLSILPESCVSCDATYCAICYTAQMIETDTLQFWKKRINTPTLCEYYKIFGYINRAFNLALLEE
jgi:radical SAM protein with 4Fe4S-binding SPASM domain